MKRYLPRILFWTLQLLVMSVDLILVAAVVTVFLASPVSGTVLAVAAHVVQQSSGGWFYAWRWSHIRRFRRHFLS